MSSSRPRSEVLAGAVLLLLALSACGSPDPEPVMDAGVDAGVSAPTYWEDIKPILDRTCVSSCHGVRTDGSGDDSFRLDVWEHPEGKRGVREMVERIRIRTSEYETMPPPEASAFPTFAERDLIAAWARAGGPYCEE